MSFRLSAVLCLLLLSSACRPMPDPSTTAPPLRFATYNASLYSEQAGGLVRELQQGSARAGKIAAVLQRVRPDVVLINEFDYDPGHAAADLFQQRYLHIAQDGGDAASVAFDAVNAGRAREMDVVMVDTAGRLPTQLHLMEELKKIRRVITKADADAPHEVLLVVDGNTGQNALAQIRAFDAALTLTGLIVTKLDGTAKGGTLAGLAAGSQGVRPVPVYWVGVGEQREDLQPFVAREFAAALLGID